MSNRTSETVVGTNVVPFPVPETAYYCGCGAENWRLLGSGEVLCLSCNSVNTPIRVVEIEPIPRGRCG